MSVMKPIDFFPRNFKKRTCGECATCCYGWLDADVQVGNTLYQLRKGNGCPLVKDNKCSIYGSDLRPKHPCDTYKCMWLSHEDFPEWMRPDKSGVILTEKMHENIEYIQMVEAGKKVDSTILANVIQYAFTNGKNLEYIVDGATYHLGSQEFMNMVVKDLTNKNTVKYNSTI